MSELDKLDYNLGRQAAIDHNGVDAMHDDGTLEYIFSAAWLKGYRETLIAIQLVKQHGFEKVFARA
jgi:hypothetical protein